MEKGLNMDLLKFMGVVAIIIAFHYLLWGQIYRGWYGHLTGISKGLLFIACILGEALITILFGIYILRLGIYK